jgi:hypothetical protein
MAFTESQKKTKLATLDRKIERLESQSTVLEALRAEREWMAGAPTVADRAPRKPRKPRETNRPAALKATPVVG